MLAWFENVVRKNVPQSVLDEIRRQLELFAGILRSLATRTVPMDKLLWGGEAGTPAGKYARITGNLLRPSTPIAHTPHVELLTTYQKMGDRALEPPFFEQSAYYRNAVESMNISGSFFDCRRPADVVNHARRFVNVFTGQAEKGATVKHASLATMPVQVRRIAYSDGCYEIVDGHHRLAIACARHRKSHKVYVRREKPVRTPLQQLVLDVFWTRGKRLLYQPIASPELGSKWHLVRRCTDRFGMMRSYLESLGIEGAGSNYVDLGSSYGWFIDQLQKLGFDAWGVERDPAAIELGQLVYGVLPERVHKQDLVAFMETGHERYDVVSCFSVIHHFALGLGSVSADEFLRLLDRLTTKVLFFDTGQEHEMWFSESLRGWNPDFIADWVRRNSSFTHVRALGVDQDWQLPGQKFNYGRTLFACTRD